MDLKEHLDTALDAAADGAPAPRPVQIPLYAGRRALRRRRLAVAAGAVAVVAALGVPVAVLAGAPGVTGEDAPPLAGSPSPVADEWADDVPVGLPDLPLCPGFEAPLSPGVDELDQGLQPELCLSVLVAFDEHGNLRRAPGVVISGLVTDLPRANADDESEKRAAVEVSLEGRRYFIHLAWMKGGASEGMEPATGTFDAWVQRGLDGHFGGVSTGDEDDLAPGMQEWWDPMTGEFRVPPGVTVIQLVENPMDLEAPHDSKGIVFEADGERFWALAWLNVTEGGFRAGGSSWDPADDAARSWPDFESWLSDMVKMQRGEPLDQLVEFGPDGTLRPLAGVRLLRQVADIDLGEEFAAAGVPTAAAEVTWEGQRWFVVARDTPEADPEYIPSFAHDLTLEQFLADAKLRYDSGEGLR